MSEPIPIVTKEEQKKSRRVIVTPKQLEEEQLVEVSVQPHMEQYADWPISDLLDEMGQGLDFLEVSHAKKSYKDFRQTILDLKDLHKIIQANLVEEDEGQQSPKQD